MRALSALPRARRAFVRVVDARDPSRGRRRASARARARWIDLDRAERALNRWSGDFARSERAYLEWDPRDERTVFERASAMNGNVRVAAFGPWRSLRFNEVEQGLTYVGDAGADADALPYEYLRVMTAASIGLCARKGLDLVTANGRLFYVGLGSGAAPAFAKKKFAACDVEVCEIDPLVADVAREHLKVGFVDARESESGSREGTSMMRVVLGDCASVLRRRDGLDIVFVDAFDGAGEIPSHLSEDAFLQTCGEALKSDGSLVLNMFNGVRGSPAREAVRDFARRLERWIGPVCSFPVMESPVNVVLSATKRGMGEPRPTREEFVTATKSVGERAGFEWSPHKLVEGAFWVDATGSGEMLESVAGGKRGVLGKFKGRNGTVMPREFENVLESD